MDNNLFASIDSLGDSFINYLDPSKSVSQTTKDFPFTSSSFAFLVASAYLAFVLLGSIFMKFLPPIDPYPLKFVYNLSQIVLCSYVSPRYYDDDDMLDFRRGVV